jgi:hypothetical protein
MSVRILISIVAIAIIAASDVARADGALMKSIEDAFETDSTKILMPVENTGAIVQQNCAICSANPLRLTPDSQFYFGDRQVTLQQFNQALEEANTTTPKRRVWIVVFVKPGQRVVTRVVAS